VSRALTLDLGVRYTDLGGPTRPGGRTACLAGRPMIKSRGPPRKPEPPDDSPMEPYLLDWLNLGVRWLARSNKGATLPCISLHSAAHA